MIGVLREQLDVQQILVVIVPVIRESLFSDSLTLMGLFYRHGKPQERIFCVRTESSATVKACDVFSRAP